MGSASRSLDVASAQPAFALTSERVPIRFAAVTHRNKGDTLADMHFEPELGIVRSGSLERRYAGHSLVLGPGDVWLHGIWEPHGFRLLKVPCSLVIITLQPSLLALSPVPPFLVADGLGLFRLPPPARPRIAVADRPRVLAIAREIAAFDRLPERQQLAWLWLRLGELLLLLEKGRPAPPADRRPTSPAALQSIEPAIEAVFACRAFIPAARAASACAMSLTTFERRFKKLMGVSFASFGLRFRIKGAAAELLGAGKKAEVVAENWGFVDLPHLHRCFVRFFGCPIRQYRERSRQA